MEFFQDPHGSLFKFTKGEYEFILDLIREENPVTTGPSMETYTNDNLE